MARIVKTSTKVKIGIKITNYYTDKTTSSTTLFVDDTVNDIKYIENSELKSATGRLSNIDTSVMYVSQNFNITNDVKIGMIEIDASKAKQSKLITIPSEAIVSYNAEEKDIEYVKVTPEVVVNFKSDLTDGSSSSMVFTQGMKLFNVQIQKFSSVLKGDFKVKTFMYKCKHAYDKPLVYGMILEGDTVEQVLFENIKVCGSKGIQITESDDIVNIISTAAEGAGLVLPVTKVSDALTLSKSITMLGNKETECAASGARATDVIAEDETVVLNTVTGDTNADIVIKGVAFTKDCYINPNGANSMTFKNCKFVETVPNKVQSLLIYDNEHQKAHEDKCTMLLQLEGCYFGTNTTVESNKMYNLINLYAKIADGSYIKNCYFAKECMTHNIINLYAVEDGATIEISGNHFEKSANAIRIGFHGHPKCKVIINNNTYDETDDANPEYAGLLLVQPGLTNTETFEDVEIEMYNNKFTGGEEKQIGYLYSGPNETQITPEKAPKVHTDGYFNFGF